MILIKKVYNNIKYYFVLQKKYVELESNYAKLLKENSELQKQLFDLEKKIEILSVKKDNHNSSLFHSNDIVKKNKSLRKKINLFPDSQKGHKGYTLKLSNN